MHQRSEHVKSPIYLNMTSFTVCVFTDANDTICYFNVRSKADISQVNRPHGTDNEKVVKNYKVKKQIGLSFSANGIVFEQKNRV